MLFAERLLLEGRSWHNVIEFVIEFSHRIVEKWGLLTLLRFPIENIMSLLVLNTT